MVKHFKEYTADKDMINKFKDDNMKNLAFFIRYEESYTNLPIMNIKEIIRQMKKINFDDLDVLDIQMLREYYTELRKQCSKADIILKYKNESKQNKQKINRI